MSHVFSSIYFYSSVQVILYRQLDEYCFNILLGAGHREPDCLLVKLNLHWHASFVYFRLPAGWRRKKYVVRYSARYQWWNYGPAAASSVSISAFLMRWKAFMTPDRHLLYRDVLVLPKPKLSGFFLARSFPLDLNLSLLLLISPFKSVDAHRIRQPPHLQITASTTKPLELKSQIRNLTWGFLDEVPRQWLCLC